MSFSIFSFSLEIRNYLNWNFSRIISYVNKLIANYLNVVQDRKKKKYQSLKLLNPI